MLVFAINSHKRQGITLDLVIHNVQLSYFNLSQMYVTF